MGILDATEACFAVDDDLLDFTLEAEEDEDPKINFKGASDSTSSSSTSSLTAAAEVSASAAAELNHGTRGGSFPEFVEEELEWLSNKDAFPSVETCFGILSDNPELISIHQSPVSVLENSSSSSSSNGNGNGSTVASFCGGLKVPGSIPARPRSKRRRRRRTAGFGGLPNKQLWSNQANVKNKQESPLLSPRISTTTRGSSGSARMGRRCLHCQSDKTPQWRAGPMGPKTLCNACGVRYKSGRLLPEYRPANSPTFSSALHSNSHRKVVEMRKQKYSATATGAGVMV